MAEAAPCLMRSISHPLFASPDSKEGDRLRALTTSVSFGRFMNEPLDWERWSAFSHNRILEDVQKYSRPGAVAEKRAFFEAYYKNFTPKKGAKPPKKENKSPNFTDIDDNEPDNKGIEPVIPSNEDACLPSITDPKFSETRDVHDIDTISSICQADEEKALTESVSSPNTNPDSSNSGVKPDTPSSKDGSLPGTNLEIKNTDDVIPSASPVEHVKPGTDIVSSQFGDVKDDVPSNKGVEPEIPSSEDVGLPSSTITVFSENRIADDMVARDRRTEHEKTSSKNVASKKIIYHVEKNKTKQLKDKKSEHTETGISWVKSSCREAAKDLMKKNSVLQSLNSSIRFSASLNKNSNLITSSKPKDKPVQQAQTRVSSVNGVKKNSQVLPRSENKSQPEALTTGSTKKPRSTTVFSSFTFRSDERAAKRKEFFQKLEEKGNTKKTDNTQQLPPKLKEKHRTVVDRKLHLSTLEEAKPSTIERKVTTNIVPKVPQRSGKKNFIEINKKNLISSMSSLSRKKLHDSTFS